VTLSVLELKPVFVASVQCKVLRAAVQLLRGYIRMAFLGAMGSLLGLHIGIYINFSLHTGFHIE